jgi:hypothetical protein
LTLFRTSLSGEPPFCFTGSPGRYLFYVVVPEFIVGIILMFCGGEKTRNKAISMAAYHANNRFMVPSSLGFGQRSGG